MFYICMSTGYRPILYAMKTFANNGGKRSNLLDIEDLSRATKWCSKEKRPCTGKCSYKQATSETTGTLWFRPKTITDVFIIFSDYSGKKVKLIVGDTGRGTHEHKRLCINIFCEFAYICMCVMCVYCM